MRPVLQLVVLIALSCLSDAQAQAPGDAAQLDQPSLARAAPAPLDVHEWGVWRLRSGRIDHLSDLARETPAFVHRAPTGPAPITPRPSPDIEIALKPVLFLHADAPMDVTVTIEMPGGEPWFYFPDAVAGVTSHPEARTVRWMGRVLPEAAPLPAGVAFPAAPGGHWWNALRGVGASPFVPRGASLAERFLFYDGPIPFRPLWAPAGRSVQPVAIAGLAPTRVAWVVGPGGATRVTSGRQRVARAALRDVGAVRTELSAALLAGGLTAAEVQSLLATWDGDLFQSPAPRAIWIIPQSEYDRMLPLTVEPVPRSTVRVGVAIQML